MRISRRNFLIGAAASLSFAGWSPLGKASSEAGNLIVILLEGGMDGLAAIPPVGDKHLKKQRESLLSNRVVMIDDFFAVHSSLSDFADMIQQGEASVVHATSIPYLRRSHFEGQNVVESGNMKPFADKTGWLGRALDEANLNGRALSLEMPLILRGNDNVDNFYPAHLKFSRDPDPLISKILAQAHTGSTANSFRQLAERYSQALSPSTRRDPIALARHAGHEMNQDNGPKAAVLRVGQFDTHANQGSERGQHFAQLELVNDIFRELRSSLGKSWNKTVVVTLTEFGRTVMPNGSAGTDHGYGTAGLLAGGLLKGNPVITDWPGLQTKNLFEERDLMVTMDYRSVLAACVEKAYDVSHERVAKNVFYDGNIERVSDLIFS